METVPRLLVPVEEVGGVLGIGRTTVYALLADGTLEHVKIGRRTLVLSECLERYVEQLRTEAADRRQPTTGVTQPHAQRSFQG